MNLNCFIAYTNVNANSNCAYEIQNRKISNIVAFCEFKTEFSCAHTESQKMWKCRKCVFPFFYYKNNVNMQRMHYLF